MLRASHHHYRHYCGAKGEALNPLHLPAMEAVINLRWLCWGPLSLLTRVPTDTQTSEPPAEVKPKHKIWRFPAKLADHESNFINFISLRMSKRNSFQFKAHFQSRFSKNRSQDHVTSSKLVTDLRKFKHNAGLLKVSMVTPCSATAFTLRWKVACDLRYGGFYFKGSDCLPGWWWSISAGRKWDSLWRLWPDMFSLFL